MARNKKVEILSNDKEVLHPMTDGDCVIFEDGQTLAQKLSEDDSVKYTPEIVNSSPMFKVGEGNTVDYSDNVLDGAYERAILQGQTYVNYIQESSADEVTLPTPFTEYERTQHNTLTSDEEGTLGINLVGQSYVNALQHDSEEEYVVLGESLEFQEKKVEYTNEGQIKSAMLKGQTLVNLDRVAIKDSSYQKYEDGWQTITTRAKNYNIWTCGDGSLFKPNTKYLVVIEVKENTLSISTDIIVGHSECIFSLGETNGKTTYQSGEIGKRSLILTTQSDLTNSPYSQRFATDTNNSVAGETITYRLMFIEYQEGMENWDIPYFEGMQSVTVSTRLENLCQYAEVENPKTGKTFNTSNSANRILTFMRKATTTLHFKPNTKYLVQFKISNLVLDGIPNITLILHGSTLSSGDCLFEEQSELQISSNNIYRAIFKTTDVVDTSEFVIKGGVGEWEGSGSYLRSMTISEIMCVEYQNGMENWDLPYFEDYQVMKPVQVESVNKNLASINTFELTSKTDSSTGSATLNQVIEVNIPLNPSLEYVFTSDNKHITALCTNEPIPHSVYQHGHNSCYMYAMTTGGKQYQYSNNLVSGYKYITITTGGATSEYDVGQTVTFNNIQLEESSTATSYVPHQSKTTYSWDEVILRKVGDVEDTLDLTTGEWVQRIGEVALDGSETWKIDAEASANNSCIFFTGVDFGGFQHFEHYEDREKYQLCDKFKIKADTYYLDENCIMVNQDARIYCRILKTQLSSPDVTGFQEWLKTNNVKISTLLAKPIVHRVNLSRPNLQVYDDITHIHTKCLDGTLIPNIYLPSDISYPAILEPSKKYNVCVNHTEVSADNPLKVNVGGTEITMTDSRMTLTTPTTLANSNVSFTGKGNKIKESMLIKNSSLLTRDLPHFNGIGSVQLGKTIENLCSASGFKVGNSEATITWHDNYTHTKISDKAGSCVFVYELIKPLENGKKYFVYSPQTLACRASFRRVYNNSLSYARQQTVLPKDGKCIIEIDQQDNLYTHICVGFHHEIPLNTEFDIYRPIICEYEPGMENWDWESIGYFTGTKNIGNEFMRVQNKNLFDKNTIKTNSALTWATGNEFTESNSFITDYIKVKQGNYIITGASLQESKLQVFGYDNNKNAVYGFRENGLESRLGYSTGVITNIITVSKSSYIRIGIRSINGVSQDVNSIQIEESSTATTYTGHKHNGLYITKDQPIELTWEQGAIFYESGVSWSQMTNNVNSMRIRTPQPLNLEPNKTYRVSLGSDKYQYGIQLYNGSNNGVFDYGWNTDREFIFTTTKDKYKVGIAVGKIDPSNSTHITPSESVHAQVRLEEVTDVILRGIGDVHDELDITRGIYTQRIGEIVLDGSNDEIWYPSGLNQNLLDAGRKNLIFYYNHENNGTLANLKLSPYSEMSSIISDKLAQITHEQQIAANTIYDFPSVTGGISVPELRIAIPVENSTTQQDSATCKAWLKENPIKVQYELATPIVHKVHIGNKNEANTEVAKPNDVFTLPTLYTEQTHIDLTNNGIIPKVQSRDYIAYPVLPMISRTYTLQHNLTGGVSNLTVDLLGRTQTITYQNHKSLIYSPEAMDAILHHELRISGKGKISGVMYIDGGYMDREIPYIEGMKNACNPIVKNVGKNLYDSKNCYIFNNGTYIAPKNWDIKPAVRVKPNTNYTITFETSSSDGKILGWKDGKFISYLGGNANGVTTKTINTGICDGLSFYRQVPGGATLDYRVTISETVTEEPYKENICYIDCGEIRLTPDMFEQGSIYNVSAHIGLPYNDDKVDGTARIRTKELIDLEPGEQYVFLGDPTYLYSMHFYDKNGIKVGVYPPYDLKWNGNVPFTIRADLPKAAIFICKANQSSITPLELEGVNVQLVKVSEIKQMRSLPNGVHDEIDLETGKYIQRVGEITFNGTESWLPGYASWQNKYTYYNNSFVDIKLAKNTDGNSNAYYDAVRCPQLHRSYMSRLASATIDGVCSYHYSGYQRIFISKQDCATVDELKLWLKENPITVQYELPKPIVKDIVIHNYPHSYEGGHVIIENGDPNTPIPAQLTYRAVTNRSGQIQQHTEQVEKQEKEINELETLILANIYLNQTR